MHVFIYLHIYICIYQEEFSKPTALKYLHWKHKDVGKHNDVGKQRLILHSSFFYKEATISQVNSLF